MKAYDVNYSTGRGSNNMKVLVEYGTTLEEAIEKKDSDFSVNSRWSKINFKNEIPLSTVKINELSVTEFRALMKN